MAPGAARAHSHHSHQQAVPQRAPAPVSYGQPGAQQPSYGQQVAHGGGRPSVMDIMEAGPSQPSADPINDLFGRFAGDDDDNHDNENDDPGPGPPLAARVVNPGRVPVSDAPARPASIGNSRGSRSRKPIASDRRATRWTQEAGSVLATAGSVRTSQSPAGSTGRRTSASTCNRGCGRRAPSPSRSPSRSTSPKYPNTITSPSWSPRGVAAAGGCSRCRGATAALLRG